jgi:hypothetical protein
MNEGCLLLYYLPQHIYYFFLSIYLSVFLSAYLHKHFIIWKLSISLSLLENTTFQTLKDVLIFRWNVPSKDGERIRSPKRRVFK